VAGIRAGLALLLVAGCHVWRERPVTAPAPTPVAHALRVTTDRGARRLTLEGATVRPDSVIGVLVDAADRRGDDWIADGATAQGQRVAVAAGDVWSLEVRRSSGTRTAVLVGAVAAVVMALALTALYIAMSYGPT
jgi:hypothetical protein